MLSKLFIQKTNYYFFTLKYKQKIAWVQFTLPKNMYFENKIKMPQRIKNECQSIVYKFIMMKISISHEIKPKNLSIAEQKLHSALQNTALKHKWYLATPNLTPKNHSKSKGKAYNQSHSTSMLPFFIHKDNKINNEESHQEKIKQSHTEHNRKTIDIAYNMPTVTHTKKKDDTVRNQKCSVQHQIYKKLNTHFRQTAEPQYLFFGDPAKNNSRCQKNQYLAKKSKSPKQIKKVSEDPIQSKSPKQFRKLSKELKQQKPQKREHNFPKFLQNKANNSEKNDEKKYLRQTIQPQVQKTFSQFKNRDLSPNNLKLNVSNQKIELYKHHNKYRFSQVKTTATHSTSSFWKNKTNANVSTKMLESQPDSPKKRPSFTKIRQVPVHAEQQTKSNQHTKPSFLMNKKSLNRFNIMKQLGRQYYCDIFLCIDKKSNGIFCLKKYNKQVMNFFPQKIEQFIKKAAFQLLAQHPNVIQLYDIFSEGEFVYTVQQFMEGGKLDKFIQTQRQSRISVATQESKSKQNQQNLINEGKIIDKIFDINSALCYLHQSCPQRCRQVKTKLPRLVHGNLTTHSIMLSMGVCKLPAFDPSTSKKLQTLEDSTHNLITEKADMWNLGLILFELCASRKLIDETIEQSKLEDSKISQAIQKTSVEQKIQQLTNTQVLKDLLKKLLVLKPQDRATSAAIMLNNLFHMYGLDIEWKQRQLVREINERKNSSKSNKVSQADSKNKLEQSEHNKISSESKSPHEQQNNENHQNIKRIIAKNHAFKPEMYQTLFKTFGSPKSTFCPSKGRSAK